MEKLDNISFEKMASPYLMGGYKTDCVNVDDILYDENSIIAILSISDYFMPSDGRYHFTAFHTQLIVSQLQMIHMYLLQGIDKKPGEAYMRDFTMKLTHQINKTKGIKIQLTRKKIRETGKGTYMKYDFDVENGSFSGNCSGLQL
ncbi:hypothetical protein [Endozoicomonas sp. Mp262]|uniref:hypothetical protein n=1 Tax=Endozoicomonas sp. Mp262 TaxID=2919499 RepID=UPI0021D83FBA